jgi:uncharacterized protein YpuA (DUF1002 family)
MSGIYNYIFGNDYNFEPTEQLKTQKFKVIQQIEKSNIKLKSVQDEINKEKKRDQLWKELIRKRKQQKRKMN